MTAEQIRAIRASLGLTQSQFGREVGGASARTVRRWEAGTCQVPGSVAKLAVRLLQEANAKTWWGRKLYPEGDEAA